MKAGNKRGLRKKAQAAKGTSEAAKGTSKAAGSQQSPANPKRKASRRKQRRQKAQTQERTEVCMADDFPELAVVLKCARCSSKLDPSRAVITGKAAGVWRCNMCNTRGVQLARLPGWQSFSSILRGSFWRQTNLCI